MASSRSSGIEFDKYQQARDEILARLEAIRRMRGIRCGFKDTSCPDQLAKALTEALKKAE